MARWTKGPRLLDLPLGSRVLDLGCNMGYVTRYLVGRYQAHGHDLSLPAIELARRDVPGAIFTHGAADNVPYDDAYFDGVLLLDVLEHVPVDRAVVAEIGRVLRSGGRLVLSVPNNGALAGLDCLNVYRRLLGRNAPPPTEDPSWKEVQRHRHYSLGELRTLLGGSFRIRSAHYTGLGVAEVVNLPLLVITKAVLRRPYLYNGMPLMLYMLVYMVEDLLPAGPWGYHLMIEADRL